jgi:hypothetical protein
VHPLLLMKSGSWLRRFSVFASLAAMSYFALWHLFSSWIHAALLPPLPPSRDERIYAPWKNVWMPLSLDEIADVEGFLRSVPSLNLTDVGGAT